MSTRAKSRLSLSFQPASLNNASNTIIEEGEPGDVTCARDQEQLIAKLRQRIDDLEINMEGCVPLSELQQAQQEWQTSEDLLRGSQRDNEKKHETIEQYKVYVKDLESIIDETLGPNWKANHQVRPPLSQSVCFSASTPLPKPSLAALRRSVSVLPSSKRSSKVLTRHVSASTLGQFNAQAVFDLDHKDDTVDETPTGAMRRLTGTASKLHPTRTIDKLGPQTRKAGPEPNTPGTVASIPEPQRSRTVLAPGGPTSHIGLEAGQVTALLALLASSGQVHPSSRTADQKVLTETLDHIAKAEKAAEARELRLRNMLAKTKTGFLSEDQPVRMPL